MKKRRTKEAFTLAEGSKAALLFESPHRNAFTLAEVLITLVIIGVIGALTVPALIQNTQKQEYASALKKAYSTLSQVTQQIIAEEGSPKCQDENGSETGWACSPEGIYDIYKKHLNNVKECSGEKGCLPKVYYWKSGAVHGNWDGTRKSLVLADGMPIVVDGWEFSKTCSSKILGSNSVCGVIWVDINGIKKPNKIGRDFFSFELKENGLFPSGCSNDYCTNYTDGVGCTCKVITENAMNY